MIKSIRFGGRWSDYDQTFNVIFSEAKARRRHALRKRYTALIHTDDGTQAAIEFCFAAAYCIIYFLDGQGRCDLCHVYDPTDDGRLFLREVATGEYEGQSRWPVGGISYNYTPDGRLKILLSKRKHLTLVAENQPVDVRSHVEPLPPFGAWEPLLRRDRGERPAPTASTLN